MYSVSVKRSFTAEHFLIGGDWGAENQPHSHDYQVELQLEGATLDRHGYLVDIVEIKAQLDALLDYFGKRSLNKLPEFEGLNPSLEQFARIFCHSLAARFQSPNLRAITVKMWEDESAWAAYRQDQ